MQWIAGTIALIITIAESMQALVKMSHFPNWLRSAPPGNEFPGYRLKSIETD
jgi:hypothetical protein